MRMTKEMYGSLQAKDLKEIAEERGLNVPSRARKEKIVEMLLELDHAEDEQVLEERRRAAEQATEQQSVDEKASDEKRSDEKISGTEETAAEKVPTGKGRRVVKSRAKRVETVKAPKAEQEEKTETADKAKAVVYAAKQEETGTEVQSQVMDAPNADAPNVTRTVAEGAAQGSTSQNSAMAGRYARRGINRPDQQIVHKNDINPDLDSGEKAKGILEVMAEGYGFIRSANYMPGDNDVYVAPSQIRRFNLKTGDILEGGLRIRNQNEKFSALLYVTAINGLEPEESKKRYNFEDMTPIFPDDRIRLEKPGASVAMRVMDLMCPVGKGQRGMIVSPPKAGKTTLMKEVAKSVKANNPEIHLIILLIDERPEEVTDIREALEGPNVEVIYSTFDELPEHHKRVAEMTIERAKRLVEAKRDVMILLDSITRLTRAYNLTEPSSGRTLSGGLDPVALHMPKRFFGAARNMREGGSLTILATALIETGSKMDDVVYEEFKGTGNMEMILNRKLSERRIFPAVDLAKSGTRRDDLLLTPDEQECVGMIRKAYLTSKVEETTDSVLELFSKTRNNGEFVNMVKKHMWSF